ANAAELYGETIHDHHAAIHVWRPPYVISMNWASPRSVLLEAGLFDEHFRRGQDVDLSYRIGRGGYRLVYRPGAIVFHRNERSLFGLAREGWQHGFHAAELHRLHAEYIAAALRDTHGAVAERVVRPSPARYRAASPPARASGPRWGAFVARSHVPRCRPALPAEPDQPGEGGR